MDHFFLNAHHVLEVQSVVDAARHFSESKPMAVASAGGREIVLATLNAAGIASIFDHIVTIEDVGKAKPEPDIFLCAASLLRVAPKNCFVFEDSKEGVEAARRAGMRCIDVSSLSDRH